MSNRLRLADELVALYREKEAGLVSAIGDIARGTGKVLQSGASAAGGELATQVGGATGKALGTAVKAAPATAAIGGGLYGLDLATDFSQEKYKQLRNRLAQGSQRYDPRTGAWY